MLFSGWPRPCPATMMKTALPSLRREPCISTSRACTIIIATGPMSCGRSGSGRWRRWCWCRPASRRRGMLEPPIGEKAVVAVFAVYILSLFVVLVWPAKKYENGIHKSAGGGNAPFCCAALCYNRTKTDETGEPTCSEIHRSTCADRWILPARSRFLPGTRRFPLPAMAAGTAAVGGRISSSPGLICGGSRPVSACRPAL